MNSQYADQIRNLIINHPLKIDEQTIAKGKKPSLASSEFLTNKEQGDWAEGLVYSSINKALPEFEAVHYGRDESLSAGDEGFDEFYQKYQKELNTVGKKPDILIFHQKDIGDKSKISENLKKPEFIQKAVAALEVRSSSFLSQRYDDFFQKKHSRLLKECYEIRDTIFKSTELRELLKIKKEAIYEELKDAKDSTFIDLSFKFPSYKTSENLKTLSKWMKLLKENMKELKKRDSLSITPKYEDLAFVNRWIQKFQIPHFYLQVFFDKAYVLSFQKILEISSDPEKENKTFFVEEDIKNQGKTTIKINISEAQEIIGKISIPDHYSSMKELERGRLLFYVKFKDGIGYLDVEKFKSEVLSNE